MVYALTGKEQFSQSTLITLFTYTYTANKFKFATLLRFLWILQTQQMERNNRISKGIEDAKLTMKIENYKIQHIAAKKKNFNK